MYHLIKRRLASHSLRGKLLKRIILILLGVTLVSTILTTLIVNNKVRESYDRLLAQTARVYAVTLNAVLMQMGPQNAARSLPYLWQQYENIGTHDIYGYRIHNDAKHTGFQLLNASGKVLVHSFNAPAKSWISKLKSGFSSTDGWRLYALYNPKNNNWIILGQDLSNRTETVRSLTLGLLVPLITVLLILMIILPRVIITGLSPLRQLAREVRHQNELKLVPVKLFTASTELDQIIGALNGLIGRVNTAIEREQQFVTNAAHELRTPLTVISLYSQELERKNTQKNIRDTIINLQQSTLRASRVVEQMLSLSKAEAESSGQHVEMINLIRLLREVIASLGIVSLQKSQILTLLGGNNDIILITGNRALVFTLFANIIDNAIRYTPEKGKITVHVKLLKCMVKVTVCDSGPGLSQEQKIRVFDRFYRGKTGRCDGVGLGLSIVTSITRKYQGTFRLSNRKDQRGLIASVTLPLERYH